MPDNTLSKWVKWEDYARLKAEVERLTALVESNLNSSKVAIGKADAVLHERDSLKAEVERLRASSFVTAVPVEQYERLLEAGDRLASALILFEMKSEEERLERIKAWSSAKEGKPSV